MSASFRTPFFDRSCFQPALNLWMAVWLVIGSYQQLDSAAPPLASNSQAFDQYLDTHQFELAEKWLHDAPESSKEKWKAASALRLAHTLNQIGCLEKATSVLENYWSIILESPMQSYGWMLKARIASIHDDLLAWMYFCQAERLLDLSNWPSEDIGVYARVTKVLQSQFNQQLEASQRLARSLMKQEAIHSMIALIERLKKDQVPECRLGTLESLQTVRSLILASAELWLELDLPQAAVTSLQDWPGKDFSPSFAKNQLTSPLLPQEMHRLILLATADMQMAKPAEALKLLQQAIEMGQENDHLPRLTLEASLKAAEALSLLHQVPQAFELLENAQPLIYQCPQEERWEASALYLEQKCHLLCQMGRVHQAIEEIDQQMDRVVDGQPKRRLLFLKARLYEELRIDDEADNAYLDLIEGSLSSQNPYIVTYLLKRAKTEKKVAQRLSSYLLKPKKPLLDDDSMLKLSQWAIETSLSSSEEVYRALKPWLMAIQDPLSSAEAKYLLVSLLPQEDASKTAPSLLAEILKTTDPHTPLHLLAEGRLITQEPQEISARMKKLIELAEKAQTQGWQEACDQLMNLAMKQAIQSPDPAIWHQAHAESEHLSQQHVTSDAWNWAYLELSFRLEAVNGQTLSQKTAQLSGQMEEKPTYWGLNSALSHSQALMRLGLDDQAIELITLWAERQDLAEPLQKRAAIELADLAHRIERSELARKWIAKILERWPQLPERPWLELRRFTLEEYENKVEGSQEVLHSIIVNYRQHPTCLCAYYLKALQGKNAGSVSEQLRLWEDVERKGQELHKQHGLSSDEHTLLASGTLQRARCLKAMNLQQQAISTLRTLLSPTGVSCSQSSGYYLLEQQARLELAGLLFEARKPQDAFQQLNLLIQDPYPSSWQAKAHLLLAQFDLDSQDPEACLEKLKSLVAATPELQAQRLLLGARAWRQLQNNERAQAHLAQLLKLDPTQDVRLAQSEGLWDYYLALHAVHPEKAYTILIELSGFKNLPLGQRAQELLQSSNKG